MPRHILTPQHRYIPAALWKLIQIRKSLGIKNAVYSYLRSDPDLSIVDLKVFSDAPKHLKIACQNSRAERYIIWKAKWD